MNYTLMKKWSLGILTLLVVISIIAILYFRYQVNHVLGANTEVVNSSQFKTLSGKLAIANVSVLSADSKSMFLDKTVLIKDKKIELIGDSITIPDNYQVIDGTGQYLIPGLIDSHVHIKKSKNDLLLYLANGVTTIGEMTGMKEHFQYFKEISDGALSPDIYIASPKVTSLQGMKPTFRAWFEKRHKNYITPLEGRKAVRKYKTLGYKAIKISSNLKPDIYFAINDEAKKLGIPTIGHLPMDMTLEDLYISGQSQLAHVSEITKAVERDFGKSHDIYYNNTEAYLKHVEERADKIALKLKEKNIVVASTIWLHENIQRQDFDLASFLKTIELKYQNPGWVEGSIISRGWLPGNSAYENPNNTDPENMRLSEIVWQTHVQAQHIVILALLRNGVTVIAGTDANGADGSIAGFSLQDELESLNKVGFSNAQVLHAATLAPSKWMQKKSGIIDVGYDADLVLLAKNPLENIKNTRTINGVMTNGKFLNRVELDKILQAIKEANTRSRKINIDEYLN